MSDTFEIQGSLRVDWELGNNRTGTRQWVCRWADRYTDSALPQNNSSKFTDNLGWADGPDSKMICRSISYEPVNGPNDLTKPAGQCEYTWCRVTAKYSTSKLYLSVGPATWTPRSESVSVGYGRVWGTSGFPCDQQLSVPLVSWHIEIPKYTSYSTSYIASLATHMNCTNADAFGNLASGTLLYHGATVQTSQDDNTGIVMAHYVHSFTYKPQGIETLWRKPQMELDAENNPVIVSGQPVFLDNGAWEKLNPPLYSTTAFAGVGSPISELAVSLV